MKEHGLAAGALKIDDAALRKVIRTYTREAGVRSLERELSAVYRKVARSITEGGAKKRVVREKDLKTLLGPEKFEHALAESQDQAGVVTGLAWTEAGGEILQIEATRMPGKGGLILTGQLGKVMQESATAAVSYVRASAKALGITDDFNAFDIHIHVPSGAIPKDGPSAGLAMATAVLSMMTGRKARRDVAMTGEITLRGRALEIGGVKEKVLAAHRAGMRTVLLPKRNEKDLVDVPKEVRKQLTFLFARSMDDVIDVALAPAAAKAPRARKGKRKR
jgi:ATP-dependent Lon protease